MSKPRVVIRAFTCRRDVAGAALLARILENEECDVLVASMRDFNRSLRWWRPHVTVINTAGRAAAIKLKFPEVKTAFLVGEGHVPEGSSLARFWLKRSDQFNAADLILLWGRKPYEEVVDVLAGQDLSKVHVVGHPALDLVRYLPKQITYNPSSRSVGFVSRSAVINDQSGRSVFRWLPQDRGPGLIVKDAQSFASMIRTADYLLKNSNFSISIRPHPLEQIEPYLKYKATWFGEGNARRVDIDTSVCFSHWAVKHRALVSPTSTSFLDAYLLKVPVINIDPIAGITETNMSWAKVSAEWQAAATPAHSYEEVLSLLTNRLPSVKPHPVIEQQLADYSDYHSDQAACRRAARLIADLAHKTKSPGLMRLPKWSLDAMDAMSFYRACWRDPLHPNMNYRKGYHKLPEHMDDIVKNILQTDRQAGRVAAREVAA